MAGCRISKIKMTEHQARAYFKKYNQKDIDGCLESMVYPGWLIWIDQDNRHVPMELDAIEKGRDMLAGCTGKEPIDGDIKKLSDDESGIMPVAYWIDGQGPLTQEQFDSVIENIKNKKDQEYFPDERIGVEIDYKVALAKPVEMVTFSFEGRRD